MDEIRNFNSILNSFKIKAICNNYQQIDNYFFYDVRLAPTAKIKDLQKYGDELSLALKTICKPNIRVLHTQGVVRLEFAFHREKPLKLFDLFSHDNVPKGQINCLLGQSLGGERIWMDVAKNPNMIIAGTTGSGKSTLIHNIIANIFNYSNSSLYLLDPKQIEFSEYEKSIRNYNIQVGYSYTDAVEKLDDLISIMETRYSDIRGGMPIENIPSIVLIIDEFADLIMQDVDEQFYQKLCKLAQKCRAAKIYIILSTQRPSANVINGVIKANFPVRVSCRVASHIDSKVILDAVGAENLLGQGDALLRDGFRHLERFQIAYTSPSEVCSYFGS